jgi:iron complex outermembrane receptor protein
MLQAIPLALGLLGFLVLPDAADSQQPAASTSAPAQADPNDGALRMRLPIITVRAEKEPEDKQRTPVSVTAVTKDTIDQAAIRTVSDAADYAPNVFFHEFTARKLSNPRFRGVGSSPNNPGVTTYIDGVPQLHANSSSTELLDIEQIEFVRGPQSALFGRNALGGLVQVITARPSLSEWSGSFIGPLGNFNSREVRATAAGPIVAGTLGGGFSFGYSDRDGYTKNDFGVRDPRESEATTGQDLDFRSALSMKGQLLWTPAANWEARAIVAGERARDGDYGLNDLGALRANPFHAARDFVGFTHRDVVAPTVLLRRVGRSVDLATTTGIVWWKTEDETDLDYTPLSLITRNNKERDLQFTQEVRLVSSKDAPIQIADNTTLKWQAGVFAFTQDYEQDAANSFSPFVLSPFLNFPVVQHSPESTLEDRGIGVYGRGTFTIREKLEATGGLRGDYERKHATLDTFFAPAIGPSISVKAEESFSDVSPHFALAYNFVPAKQMVYASASRGFKAGGFNAASPTGSDAYGEEHSWNYEAGVKSVWFDDRVSVNGAVFYLTWVDLQVNVPNPFVPAQFFIANAAGATSKGAEVEFLVRLMPGCDFFGSLGYTDARFDEGSSSNGVAVGGNRLSNTPNYTTNFGGQYSAPIAATISLYGRADVTVRGDYEYDDANTERQDAYSLANFRAGIRGRLAFVEAWIRNAFDTHYIPVAFAYPGLAPSGFVGEMGAPRTYGVRAGVSF